MTKTLNISRCKNPTKGKDLGWSLSVDTKPDMNAIERMNCPPKIIAKRKDGLNKTTDFHPVCFNIMLAYILGLQ